MPYRTNKFWKRRLIFRLFTMMVTNAFIKFRENPSSPKYNYPVFRFHLSFSMVSAKCSDFYNPSFSMKSNTQNSLARALCTKCRRFSRATNKSYKRCKQKCYFCSNPVCNKHLLLSVIHFAPICICLLYQQLSSKNAPPQEKGAVV